MPRPALTDPRRLGGVQLYSAAIIGRSARDAPVAGFDTLLQALDWLAYEGVPVVDISLTGP
ncbi:hypothetical protein [Roseivivax marinus]|nr:hypothetical protein [Roseivivax marinus]